MKIQFILNYSDLYGANRSMLTFIEYAHKNGYEINVMLPSHGSMVDKLKKDGIEYKIVPHYSAFLYLKPIIKHLLVPILSFFNLFSFPFLVYKIKKFNPDIIYSNTSSENFGIFIAKILNKKHISHIREFMSLDYNSFFIFGRKNKKKFINRSNGVIFVSKAVAENVLLNEFDSKKHIVIYNGFSIPEIILKKELPDFNAINFGIVGILDPAKQQSLAIQYFSELLELYPNSKLHLFGDKNGFYKKQLLKLQQDLNLTSNVIFHGFEENTDSIYSQIDILFMFSKAEGFGRVTVEAMVRHIPVIGFDNAGTSELISNRISGCLFSDKAEFFDGIKFIMNPKNYILIQQKAFEVAMNDFNDKLYCRKIEEFVMKF